MSLGIVVAALGCAAQTPVARDARLAGEWTFRLPETHSPYANLAIGEGGQPSTLGLVDEALAANAAPERAAPQPKTRQRPATQLAKQASTPAPQPTAAPTAPASAPEPVVAPPVTSRNDEQLYAQREAQSQQQRDFRGGDAVVISVSALVIILLVVLLIILLT